MAPKRKSINIGYCLPLTGPHAAVGQTARLAHRIWQDDVNGRGGLLGRHIQFVCVDDRTDPERVPSIYGTLLSNDEVDLVIGGLGTNSIRSAMPSVVENQRFFVGLMGMAANDEYRYDRFFSMTPTGSNPTASLTQGFFEVASRQTPKPETVAILAGATALAMSPIASARANASRCGFEVVAEARYGRTTEDFSPLLRTLNELAPDVLFLCSGSRDSVGLLRAVAEVGTSATVLGGAINGLHSSVILQELGPLLNGLLNYEYWVPAPDTAFPGVQELIATYQRRARRTRSDELGYHVAPLAYAQLQIVGQAIKETGGLDDADLAEYCHSARFQTVMGQLQFDDIGEWEQPRVLTVQFGNITSHSITEFENPHARTVLHPDDYRSGSGKLDYPYAMAR
jgi:branched-chain amino acid transport system substrate-binding protein